MARTTIFRFRTRRDWECALLATGSYRECNLMKPMFETELLFFGDEGLDDFKDRVKRAVGKDTYTVAAYSENPYGYC